MRWQWTDQSRQAARGAVHAQRLPPDTQRALGDLLIELLAGQLSREQFEDCWAVLPLEPADGLPHLLHLAHLYLRHLQAPDSFPNTPSSLGPTEWRGPHELAGLIGVYLDHLATDALPPHPDLPIPATPTHPLPHDLPIPHNSSAAQAGHHPLPANPPRTPDHPNTQRVLHKRWGARCPDPARR